MDEANRQDTTDQARIDELRREIDTFLTDRPDRVSLATQRAL